MVERLARTALLLGVSLVSTGCVAVAVAAGAAAAYGIVKYTDNEALADFEEDADTVWEAALVSLSDHGYPVSTDAPRVPSGGEVDVNDVELHVIPVTQDVTRVTVRVGTFETDTHKARARSILDGISDQLD